jgi:hypothetical protein
MEAFLGTQGIDAAHVAADSSGASGRGASRLAQLVAVTLALVRTLPS